MWCALPCEPGWRWWNGSLRKHMRAPLGENRRDGFSAIRSVPAYTPVPHFCSVIIIGGIVFVWKQTWKEWVSMRWKVGKVRGKNCYWKWTQSGERWARVFPTDFGWCELLGRHGSEGRNRNLEVKDYWKLEVSLNGWISGTIAKTLIFQRRSKEELFKLVFITYTCRYIIVQFPLQCHSFSILSPFQSNFVTIPL